MNLTIEDVRKSLSSICHWLTTNRTLSFLRDDNNRPTTARGIECSQQLEKCMTRSRWLFNKFSESIEDTEVLQQNSRIAIEKEKIARKQEFFNKRAIGKPKDE
jgi:hypothetical protein